MLTTLQRRFLSARAVSLTDEDAADAANVTHLTVRKWKEDNKDFLAAYNQAMSDIVEATRYFAYGLLDKASVRLEEMLDADKVTKQGDIVADWDARGRAIDLLYTSSGIKNNKLDISGNVGVQVINDAIPRPAQD